MASMIGSRRRRKPLTSFCISTCAMVVLALSAVSEASSLVAQFRLIETRHTVGIQFVTVRQSALQSEVANAISEIVCDLSGVQSGVVLRRHALQRSSAEEFETDVENALIGG